MFVKGKFFSGVRFFFSLLRLGPLAPSASITRNMYTQIWNKYLPIIRILLKRSTGSEQTLNLNATDFERAGATRKSGYKFHINFVNGRVDNIISASPIARDLADVLLQDALVRELFSRADYYVTMDAKFNLGIRFAARPEVAGEEPAPEEAVAEEASL